MMGPTSRSMHDEAESPESASYDMRGDREDLRPRGALSEDERAIAEEQGPSAIGQWIHEWVSRQARHKQQHVRDTSRDTPKEKIAPNYILEPPVEPLDALRSNRRNRSGGRGGPELRNTDFQSIFQDVGSKRSSPTIITQVSRAERERIEAVEGPHSPLMELYLQVTLLAAACKWLCCADLV